MALIGRTMSWKTCLVNVISRTAGVVENLINWIRGGMSQPNSARNSGLLPKGIMCLTTQKMLRL